jgi:hypothetical protein
MNPSSGLRDWGGLVLCRVNKLLAGRVRLPRTTRLASTLAEWIASRYRPRAGLWYRLAMLAAARAGGGLPGQAPPTGEVQHTVLRSERFYLPGVETRYAMLPAIPAPERTIIHETSGAEHTYPTVTLRQVERMMERLLFFRQEVEVAARPAALSEPFPTGERRPQDAQVRVEIPLPRLVNLQSSTGPPLPRLAAVQGRPAPPPPQPPGPEHPSGSQRRSVTQADLAPQIQPGPPAVDINQLTEQVLKTLDRRLIAFRERMGRE